MLRSDGRLRINAQLVRAADDAPLWSGSFDRELKDVFAIQDEISRSIVNELRLKLGRGQRRYNTNLEAYELYLKARAHRRSHRVLPRLVLPPSCSSRSLRKDPAFAPAYAGLADAWATMSINCAGAAADEAFADMQPAAEKALQLDPLLAEAHAAIGVVLARDRKWTDAEAAFRRALELNAEPHVDQMNFVVSTLLPQGKVDESLQPAPDRLSVRIRCQSRCEGSWHGCRSARAATMNRIDIGRRVLAVDPNHTHTRQVMRTSAVPEGRNGRGDPDLRAARDREATTSVVTRTPSPAGAPRLKRWQRSAKTFRRAWSSSMPALATRTAPSRRSNAWRLEEDPRVGIYLTYPELAFLRNDPRLAAFRRKLNLPRD